MWIKGDFHCQGCTQNETRDRIKFVPGINLPMAVGEEAAAVPLYGIAGGGGGSTAEKRLGYCGLGSIDRGRA